MVVFYKKEAVSPFYAAYLNLIPRHANKIRTVVSEGTLKDAADVAMNTYVVANVITKFNTPLDSFKEIYIITGDEFSTEIIVSANNKLNSQVFNRINSQMPSPLWIINPVDFPRKDFGDLLYLETSDNKHVIKKSTYNINDINFFLNGIASRDNNRNPICSPVAINIIKSGLHVSNRYDVESVLKYDNVRRYENFIDILEDSRFASKKFQMKDQFLKLTGAKFFTNSELRNFFLSDHYEVINDLINDRNTEEPSREYLEEHLENLRDDLMGVNNKLNDLNRRILGAREDDINELKRRREPLLKERDFIDSEINFLDTQDTIWVMDSRNNGDYYRKFLTANIIDKDILNVYYKYNNIAELFYVYLDINISLGIFKIDFDTRYRTDEIRIISRLFIKDID